MTDKAIQTQIAAIEKVATKALQSRESAQTLLRNAGILKQPSSSKNSADVKAKK